MSAEGAPVGYTNGTSSKWNTKGQIIAAATILPAVGLLCVGMRFWARFHRRAGFGLDDAFVVPALVCPLFAIYQGKTQITLTLYKSALHICNGRHLASW